MSAARPHEVWPHLAEPARWSTWAPHVRGAWGLDHAEVAPGRRILVRLLGVVPVPATITAVEHGRAWSWRVGGVTLGHRVTPRAAGGSRIEMTLSAPPVLEGALARTYGPVVGHVCRRLADAAGRAAGDRAPAGATRSVTDDRRTVAA